ncbi:hypothetical protein Ancab_008822 [Ancistrocladus abbreviatus]
MVGEGTRLMVIMGNRSVKSGYTTYNSATAGQANVITAQAHGDPNQNIAILIYNSRILPALDLRPTSTGTLGLVLRLGGGLSGVVSMLLTVLLWLQGSPSASLLPAGHGCRPPRAIHFWALIYVSVVS